MISFSSLECYRDMRVFCELNCCRSSLFFCMETAASLIPVVLLVADRAFPLQINKNWRVINRKYFFTTARLSFFKISSSVFAGNGTTGSNAEPVSYSSRNVVSAGNRNRKRSVIFGISTVPDSLSITQVQIRRPPCLNSSSNNDAFRKKWKQKN